MIKKIFSTFLVLVVVTSVVVSQTIYLPANHNVYEFLKRMEAKGLLDNYRDAALPLSRLQIADYLRQIELSYNRMTDVEQDLFEFYKTEFKYELLILEGDPEPTEIRWHVISTELFDGQMNFDFNYMQSYKREGRDITRMRSLGFKLYGYAYKDLGYYFNIVDNIERADKLNPNRLYRSDRGMVIASQPSSHEIQHDENDAQLTLQLGKVALSLEKGLNNWGYGRRGEVIFSDRAPSYPMVKLRFPLSKSIDFVYFHGELNSNQVDSGRSYSVVYPSVSFFRRVDQPKYIAAHQIEFSIINGLDLSLGESVVYSDKGPLLIYLIPIMFFKAAEHYNRDPDNTQIFGSLDINLILNINFYTSLFIDEINTDNFFDEFKSRKQIAYTIGARFFDIPLSNVDVNVEYTRVNPGVYNHKFPAVTFTNSDFVLGSWIGQNADLFNLELAYNPFYKLRLSSYFEKLRKGSDLSIADQYSSDQGKKGFLYGSLHKESVFGIQARYQPVRDIYIDTFLQWRTVSDDQYSSLNRSNQPEFGISARLGFW